MALRRAGLYLGAEWSETGAGTCAVGTALATGQALTVHQVDHFDATHLLGLCAQVASFLLATFAATSVRRDAHQDVLAHDLLQASQHLRQLVDGHFDA